MRSSLLFTLILLPLLGCSPRPRQFARDEIHTPPSEAGSVVVVTANHVWSPDSNYETPHLGAREVVSNNERIVTWIDQERALSQKTDTLLNELSELIPEPEQAHLSSLRQVYSVEYFLKELVDWADRPSHREWLEPEQMARIHQLQSEAQQLTRAIHQDHQSSL